MQNSWLVLVPPVIVLLAAFITRKLNPSLLTGLCVAALVFTDGNPMTAATHATKALWAIVTDVDNLYMYAFLFTVSILIILLERTGGARAFAHALTQRLRDARTVETSSMLMSSTLFIDDYLSTLTVGYVMRPLTDRFKIARAKLAFLIHTLSGPLVIMVPITSWLTMITTNLDQVGISSQITATTTIIGDPFSLYVRSIPFIFYSLLMLASIWFIVRMRISYGPMHTQETIAHTTGNLFGGKTPFQETAEPQLQPSDSIADLLIPMITLISSVIAGILYVGDFHAFGGQHSFIEALQKNTQTALVLCIAGAFTLLLSFVIGLIKKQIKPQQIPTIVTEGVQLIISAVIMLILVSALGLILKNDLRTGHYLATALLGSLSISLLPCMFFIVAATCSIMIGSSWGTISMLIPIAIPMLITFSHQTAPLDPDTVPLLFPLLGAIFSGAVCGDHISPISQTTVMAATSSGCYPLDHVNTQLPYAIPAIIFSALAFLIAGYVAPYGLMLSFFASCGLSLLLTLATLYALNRWQKKS